MVPQFIVYVDPENIEEASKLIVSLRDEGFAPMVSAARPRRSDLEGMNGLTFNEYRRGTLPKDFYGKYFCLVWFTCPMEVKDLEKLIPYFEARFRFETYVFNREDDLLKEFTQPRRDIDSLERDSKKQKV